MRKASGKQAGRRGQAGHPNCSLPRLKAVDAQDGLSRRLPEPRDGDGRWLAASLKVRIGAKGGSRHVAGSAIARMAEGSSSASPRLVESRDGTGRQLAPCWRARISAHGRTRYEAGLAIASGG